ncbi:uncharacterized protein GIQ15_06376 [Arthroderma uncinatum]|uniref:uncharacterized protein n=1 Tax=Arthroderma uncinatum TaxID=74035 RepID=UPI00144A5B07|nr:uncharacterized protein GIQ15_06376 [Arthroderma uncinatum]KAF3481029.1 hypothetical protein GIQ15_06376 [Arthroderma uncinatum]
MHITTEGQIWLTTEDPEDLAKKYSEYAHGDTRKERRIVLDKATLGQAKAAVQRDEQLIVFVFGHGDQDTHGIRLGRFRTTSNKTPLLLMRDFARAVPKEAKVTLFTTAFYSGGWLVQPNTNKAKFLNVTGITGSAVDEEGDDKMEVLTHPTYIGLASSIFEKISTIYSLASEQRIHFSAQDDEWETHFGKRTGFQLNHFKEGWESLRSIPPSGTKSPELDSSGDTTSRTASIDRELTHRAVEYLSSKPEQTILDADDYIQVMGIEAQSIKEFEIDQWKADPQTRTTRNKIIRQILQARLFDPPLDSIGLYYSKPTVYLAIILAETCKSSEEIADKISLALEAKSLRMENIVAQLPAEQIVNDAQVAEDSKSFFQEMKKLGHKVRLKTF